METKKHILITFHLTYRNLAEADLGLLQHPR